MVIGLRAWWEKLPLTDPLQRKIAEFFQVVLAGWFVLATLGFPLNFLRGAGGSPSDTLPTEQIPPLFMAFIWLLFVAMLMLWLSPVAALALLRRGRFGASVALATWGLLLGHSIATIALGIADASVLVVYQIPIALAGLLGGRRMLVAVSGYSIILVILVGLFQLQTPPMAGFFSAAAMVAATGSTPPPLDLGQPIGFFIAVTLLSSLLLDRIGGALRMALSDSQQREAELQAIRGSLETTVSKRTAELASALTESRQQSAEQARLLEEIEAQRGVIRELSVPVLPVSRDTLVMPLVGALDSARLVQIQEQALSRIEITRARCLLLDITGVPVVDSQVAQGLVRVVQAAKLLGADVALVGIRPEVAQTIVGLGLDLRGIRTYSVLQEALAAPAGRESR